MDGGDGTLKRLVALKEASLVAGAWLRRSREQYYPHRHAERRRKAELLTALGLLLPDCDILEALDEARGILLSGIEKGA